MPPLCPQEEVAAPYVRLLALIVRRNQATISGEHPLALLLLVLCTAATPDAITLPGCLPRLSIHCVAALHPLLADYFKEMQLSLEHVAFLPPNAAIALLLAVWPMCRRARSAGGLPLSVLHLSSTPALHATPACAPIRRRMCLLWRAGHMVC